MRRKKPRIYKQGERWTVLEFWSPDIVQYTNCQDWQSAVDYLLTGSWWGVKSMIWSA